MRKDFVANVSHELKTPLTSITGFVETLKINDEIDKATRNHFLDIIEKESNRLKGLIEDILMLSSIENGQDLSYEQVKLFDIFNVFKFANLLNTDISSILFPSRCKD